LYSVILIKKDVQKKIIIFDIFDKVLRDKQDSDGGGSIFKVTKIIKKKIR
jgi:hypothetical protein